MFPIKNDRISSFSSKVGWCLISSFTTDNAQCQMRSSSIRWSVSDQLIISCSVSSYISRFFNRFEIARRSAWADAVSSNIEINQLGNSDNADTCIKHNAKIFFIEGLFFYENKRSLKIKVVESMWSMKMCGLRSAVKKIRYFKPKQFEMLARHWLLEDGPIVNVTYNA